MSASGVQPAFRQSEEAASREFHPLGYLLHALNQPLTGLQCSLELAAAGPRTVEQYVRTLREGLELTARMRILVEALREIVNLEEDETLEAIRFDVSLRNTLEELRPVAEARQIELRLLGNEFARFCRVRRNVGSALFRLLESAVSLARQDSVLRVSLDAQAQDAVAGVCWRQADGGEARSPFSPQELGLLVARSTWERAGGRWEDEDHPADRTILLRLPWAVYPDNLPSPICGGAQ